MLRTPRVEDWNASHGCSGRLEWTTRTLRVDKPNDSTAHRPMCLEGKAEGKLGAAERALLTVLRIRGIAVPDGGRARIEGQHDLPTLERWLESAATATSIAAVFDDPT